MIAQMFLQNVAVFEDLHAVGALIRTLVRVSAQVRQKVRLLLIGPCTMQTLVGIIALGLMDLQMVFPIQSAVKGARTVRTLKWLLDWAHRRRGFIWKCRHMTEFVLREAGQLGELPQAMLTFIRT